ncbi:MAG TPA: carboxypeptidase-like regulatory domain-containing protein [Cyclobacteriaceae bacterium]|jgi:hypothetical protein|nr:carboxypeptidase-like regulatory domain-containing protein [Cyclobacteriaceae bacterium]
MKTFNKFLYFSLLLVIGLLPSCKDNILTPVNNTKSADSLVALINTLNTKLVTVNAKDNTLKIQLAKFQSTDDSLKAAANGYGNYSQSVQYTVYLVDGGNSITGMNYYGDRTCKDCKTNGVDGATVTVYSNGQTYTATSADGRAIFNNLYVAGLATVTIKAPGYTGSSYTTYFNPNYNNVGGISSVSFINSNFSDSYNTYYNLSPTSTTGSGSGATFNFTFGSYGNSPSVSIINPGAGYQTGDLIIFDMGNYCDCGGSLTYKVTSGSGNMGSSFNASTNVLILPTSGKNVTTYTGQLYINKSVMDDTLGRLYNKSTDAARYLTFISPNGPYHGTHYSDNYLGADFAQNQYFAPPSGTQISFTNLTTLTGINFIYGYPTYVSNYYDPNPYSYNNGNTYQYLPGDIISITYTGLTAFATIDATGKYTMAVPSFQNNPGTTIGAISGVGNGGGGNLIHVQDNYTYLSSTNSTGSTHPTLKVYNPTTYAITTSTAFYQVTQTFDFYPFIELDNDDGYAYIGGYSGYTQQFRSNPGQTVSRNIFFFATSKIGG